MAKSRRYGKDPFLAQSLPWKYIDDLLIMDLLQPQPRKNVHKNGVLDIDAIEPLFIISRWMNLQNLQLFSQAVHQKDAPLKNCWGFIDGTARRICRPSKLQQEHYSGHKRFHCQKYQAVMCANGIICQLDGPFRGRRHDAGILKDTRLYENNVKVARGNKYVIIRDPAYPLKPLLLKPYGCARLQPYQVHFNKCMSTVRQAVEWSFGKVAADFTFVDFHKNLKVTRQRVGRMYKVATLLTNCRTCLYDSQVSMYFGLEQPSLSDYLIPFN
ncbi:hypothetical protein MRX96_035014 [Rhipicephalus microplus]